MQPEVVINNVRIQAIDNLIHLIYQSAIDGKWENFLTALMSYTTSNNAWIALLNADSLQPEFLNFITLTTDVNQDAFLAEYMPRIAEDPFFVHTSMMAEGEFLRGSDVVSENVLHNSSLYPLFERGGCEYMLAAIPIRTGQLNSFVVLNRNKQCDDYSSDDLALMKQLVPHFNRAFYMYHKLLRQQQQLSLYHTILTHTPYALIAVDEKMNVLAVSQKAENMLTKQSILHINSTLTCKQASHTAALRNFVDSTLSWLSASSPEPSAIRLSSGDNVVMLRGYPIDGVTAGNDFSKTCCVLELIADAVPCWSLFAEEFSLSAKELRTIQGLYNGGSLQEVAEQHSLSFNTVKSQLLAVYRKMGIKNQRQLMMALTKYT